MAILSSERHAVQNPLVRYAQDARWKYVTREEALRLRRSETGLLFGEVLVSQLKRLNPEVMNDARAEAVAAAIARVPATIEGNLQAREYLRGLKTVFVEEEKRERNVRVIDPASGSQANFETLITSFLQPARILRVFTDFILFTRTDGDPGGRAARFGRPARLLSSADGYDTWGRDLVKRAVDRDGA